MVRVGGEGGCHQRCVSCRVVSVSCRVVCVCLRRCRIVCVLAWGLRDACGYIVGFLAVWGAWKLINAPVTPPPQCPATSDISSGRQAVVPYRCAGPSHTNSGRNTHSRRCSSLTHTHTLSYHTPTFRYQLENAAELGPPRQRRRKLPLRRGGGKPSSVSFRW